MTEESAELQAKLKVAEQEMEDAKEALRIERAKMTREKKQVTTCPFFLRSVACSTADVVYLLLPTVGAGPQDGREAMGRGHGAAVPRKANLG
jgi:hypothetical protein